jgi:hypothetical protein
MAVTAPRPTKADAYEAALKTAYASLEAAKNAVDFALDDLETARDEARRIYGTPEATSSFGNALSDLHLASRVITHAIDDLPPLDEGDGPTEEGAASETEA